MYATSAPSFLRSSFLSVVFQGSLRRHRTRSRCRRCVRILSRMPGKVLSSVCDGEWDTQLPHHSAQIWVWEFRVYVRHWLASVGDARLEEWRTCCLYVAEGGCWRHARCFWQLVRYWSEEPVLHQWIKCSHHITKTRRVPWALRAEIVGETKRCGVGKVWIQRLPKLGKARSLEKELSSRCKMLEAWWRTLRWNSRGRWWSDVLQGIEQGHWHNHRGQKEFSGRSSIENSPLLAFHARRWVD